MTIIKVIANDQLLTIAENPTIASGDQKSVQLQVETDSVWDKYALSATFFTDKDRSVYEMILVDNACIVPHEVLSSSCKLSIGIRGVRGDGIVKTSSLVRYKIFPGAKAGDSATIEPTPDTYQQILTAYEAVKKNATDAQEMATVASQDAEEAKNTADTAKSTAESALSKAENHDHDERYYTQSEVDEIRSALETLINANPVTLEALGITASATELNHMKGVTAGVQGQLDGKAPSNHNHDGVYAPNQHSHAYLPTANVVNNLTTTGAGYALDARQGKALNDKIPSVSTSTITPTSIGDDNTNIKSVVQNDIRKYGKIVQISFFVTTPNSFANGAYLGTVPSGYRPLIEVELKNARVQTDGKIYYIGGNINVGGGATIKVCGCWFIS